MRTSGLRTAKPAAAAFHSVLLPANGLTFSTLSSSPWPALTHLGISLGV